MSSSEEVIGEGLVVLSRSVFSIAVVFHFVSGVTISFLSEMVFSFISLQSGGGMSQISFGFPGIVSGGISLPFDEVNIASSLSFVRDYRFHFVFVFSFDKVRWRTRVIGSVDFVFVIWR